MQNKWADALTGVVCAIVFGLIIITITYCIYDASVQKTRMCGQLAQQNRDAALSISQCRGRS